MMSRRIPQEIFKRNPSQSLLGMILFNSAACHVQLRNFGASLQVDP